MSNERQNGDQLLGAMLIGFVLGFLTSAVIFMPR